MTQILLPNGFKEESPVLLPIRQDFDFQASGETANRGGTPTRTPARAALRDHKGEASKRVDQRVHAAAEGILIP